MALRITLKTAMVVVVSILGAGCQETDSDDGCSHSLLVGEENQALAVAGRWAIPPRIMAVGAMSRVPITSAGPWQGMSSCSGTFTEGARRVQAWIQRHWPQVSSIGGYSCRSINGNNAVTSIHAVGRALDIMLPLDNGQADNSLGDPIANYFVEHAAEIGVQRVIWDRTYWRSGDAPREGHYDGAHPHHDHIHLELSTDAANLRTPFFENGELPPDQTACADPLPQEGGVIDDEGRCFFLYGPARFWRSVGDAGHNGHLYWTNAFQNETASNWARWRFEVSEDGEYDVSTHTVAAYSLFAAPSYRVRHAGGETLSNPNVAGVTGWTNLGRYRFRAGQSSFVDVFDHVRGAVPEGQHITADAIRVTAVQRPVVVDMSVPDMSVPDMPAQRDAGQLVPRSRDAAPMADESNAGRAVVSPDAEMEIAYTPRPGYDDSLSTPPDAGRYLDSPRASPSIHGSCAQQNSESTPSVVFLVLCLTILSLRWRRGTTD